MRVRRSGSDGGPRLFLDPPGAPHPELAAWRRQTERRPGPPSSWPATSSW
ncbi:hypothetical protein [Jiangella anatolica]|nr:hypothetical protein [Jiangella anatolica]